MKIGLLPFVMMTIIITPLLFVTTEPTFASDSQSILKADSRVKKCISWKRLCYPVKRCNRDDYKALSKCDVCEKKNKLKRGSFLKPRMMACNKLSKYLLENRGWKCTSGIKSLCSASGKECYFKCVRFF